MKKTWLYAAAASAALAAFATAPAYAVQRVDGVICAPGTCTFGIVPDGTDQGAFSNSGLAGGPGVFGAFSDQYTFTVAGLGFLNTTTGTSPGNNAANSIQGFTLTLTGPAGFAPVSASDINPGFAAFAGFENVLLTQLGTYTLTVSGLAGRLGSVYSGTYSFLGSSFGPGPGPDVVPLPGALALMGSVVLGGAGFARYRRRKQVAAA